MLAADLDPAPKVPNVGQVAANEAVVERRCFVSSSRFGWSLPTEAFPRRSRWKMQNLASLEKGCSRSAHQAGAEEKSLCDLMDLNGLKRLCAFAFRWEQIPPAPLPGCRQFLVILLHKVEGVAWWTGPFPVSWRILVPYEGRASARVGHRSDVLQFKCIAGNECAMSLVEERHEKGLTWDPS